MDIIPFEKVGDIFFKQNIKEFKKTLNRKLKASPGERVELDKIYPSFLLPKMNLYVVFTVDGSSIRYFEADGDIYYQDINLHNTSLAELEAYFRQMDENITVDQESVESRKLGIVVSNNPDKEGNLVLVYAENYKKEEEISPDDIIKFYLGG